MNVLVLGTILEKSAAVLKSNGHKIFLLNDPSLKIGEGVRKLVEKIWLGDLFHPEGFTDRVIDEFRSESIDLVINHYESFVLTKSVLSSKLGLPGLTYEAAIKAGDKVLMRQAFVDNYPEITPAFTEVESLEDAKKFALQYGYPVMLKPANLAKSLLISRCDDNAGLAKYYQYMQEQISDLYAIKAKRKRPKILIGKYLEGTLYSVDLMTDDQGEVITFDPVELIFAKDIGVEDNHNFARFLPMRSGQDKSEELKLAATKAAKAIGLTNCPAHVELIDTKDGVFVIEIGARWGGFRPQMHLLAQGLDLYELELRMLSGQKIDTKPRIRNYVAVIELFSYVTGAFVNIRDLDSVKRLSCFHSMATYPKQGATVGLAKNGYSPAASITLSSKDTDQLEKDYSFIKDNVVVEID